MVVIDASVAVKWFLEEDGSAEARTYLSENDLTAPDIILAEVQNALFKRWRMGQATARHVFDCVPLLDERLKTIASTRDLADAAATIALSTRHPIYDCLYVALAEQLTAPLVTADQKLARVASEFGVETQLISVDG